MDCDRYARSRGRIAGDAGDIQARFLHVSELLTAFGPNKVGMPHVRPLEGNLWEMRRQGRDGIARAIYFTATGRRVMVLHVFTKRTQKTPRAALLMEHYRKEELES